MAELQQQGLETFAEIDWNIHHKILNNDQTSLASKEMLSCSLDAFEEMLDKHLLKWLKPLFPSFPYCPYPISNLWPSRRKADKTNGKGIK